MSIFIINLDASVFGLQTSCWQRPNTKPSRHLGQKNLSPGMDTTGHSLGSWAAVQTLLLCSVICTQHMDSSVDLCQRVKLCQSQPWNSRRRLGIALAAVGTTWPSCSRNKSWVFSSYFFSLLLYCRACSWVSVCFPACPLAALSLLHTPSAHTAVSKTYYVYATVRLRT